MDEERLYVLEQNLKDRSEAVVESEKRYDEVLQYYICVAIAISSYPSVSCSKRFFILFIQTSVNAVSYTHLTLPTKRIV